MNKAITQKSTLQQSNPTLSREWHPSKNDSLTPEDVKPKSNKKVWWRCQKKHEWQARINDRNSKGRGCPYCSGRRATPEDNLAVKYPEVAKELHPSKNRDTDPFNIKTKSHQKLWWLCPKGHEYQAAIYSRTSGSGCPYCAGQAVHEKTSFAALYPSIAKEWHIEKNRNYKPDNFNPGSGKNFWWQCMKGHEWRTSINNRSKGSNCPYCHGLRASPDSNLLTINPHLASEWNTLKNKRLRPEDFRPNSGKKVWWICPKGHEWEATIASRNSGNNCPGCSGKMVTDDNNLAYLHPELIKEWDFESNKDLNPKHITPGSHKRVWWKCSFNHSWNTAIYNRAYGRGCPYCTKQTSKLEVRLLCELETIFKNVQWRKKVSYCQIWCSAN